MQRTVDLLYKPLLQTGGRFGVIRCGQIFVMTREKKTTEISKRKQAKSSRKFCKQAKENDFNRPKNVNSQQKTMQKTIKNMSTNFRKYVYIK